MARRGVISVLEFVDTTTDADVGSHFGTYHGFVMDISSLPT